MLLLSNRVKLCSLAFTATRMYSSGPAAANKNPTVYFDIAADGQLLGRVTFEVRGPTVRYSLSCYGVPAVCLTLRGFILVSRLVLLQLNADVVPKTAGKLQFFLSVFTCISVTNHFFFSFCQMKPV